MRSSLARPGRRRKRGGRGGKLGRPAWRLEEIPLIITSKIPADGHDSSVTRSLVDTEANRCSPCIRWSGVAITPARRPLQSQLLAARRQAQSPSFRLCSSLVLTRRNSTTGCRTNYPRLDDGVASASSLLGGPSIASQFWTLKTKKTHLMALNVLPVTALPVASTYGESAHGGGRQHTLPLRRGVMREFGVDAGIQGQRWWCRRRANG